MGNDLGVLRSVDRGLTWTVLDDIHFPRAPMTDLVLARNARILRAATYGRGVFEFTTAQGPVIAVNLQDGLDFETVCVGSREDLTLQIFNVGVADLVITSVKRLMGSPSVTVLPMPGTPLVIAPGEIPWTSWRNRRPHRNAAAARSAPHSTSTSTSSTLCGRAFEQADRRARVTAAVILMSRG